jgi:hypothetical protein
MGALWQLKGVLEWLYLGHSPVKVLTPHHELVARLIAKGCTHCEFLEHEPVILLSSFQKINSFVYGTFQLVAVCSG